MPGPLWSSPFRSLVLILLGVAMIYGCGREQKGDTTALPLDDIEAEETYWRTGAEDPSPESEAFAINTPDGDLLSGRKCLQKEIFNVVWRERAVFYVCHPNQWILTHDFGEGPQSFLVRLRRDHYYSANYHMRPISPASDASWDMVHEYTLRFQGQRPIMRRK